MGFSCIGQGAFCASGSRYVGERILVNLYLPVALKSVWVTPVVGVWVRPMG